MIWAAVADVEAELAEARREADLDRFLGLLGDEELFVPIHRPDAEKLAGQRSWSSAQACCEHDGEPSLQVFTRGALPDFGADVVFLSGDLDWALHGLAGADPVVFNRGTPGEWRVTGAVVLPWLDANPDRVTAVEQQVERLNTAHYGRFDGPVARALACGAQQAALTAEPWNVLDPRYHDYVAEVRGLRDWWGVGDAADWRRAVARLLGDQYVLTPGNLVLVLRAQHDEELDPVGWAELVRYWCAENDAGHQSAELLGTVGRIVRYEQRLRADEVLPPDGAVGTTIGWDVGRAIGLARWGLAVGHCDALTAELMVLEAGAVARRYHQSWAELSASYLMGRVLALDGEEFGEAYESAVRVHHLLLQDPASPWVNLDFAPAEPPIQS
ncbi:DUF1266 domain-containing protein [Amycolatopsis sp. PS_44_ISF1]|uniref:DUF1266 domain-containing protein n=1 Tax=Amycolatopsis sp. PS_44_ISF1 TaxID=2974917 RepID=UPI0028DDEB9B|nr:DUF1266 domain-containing protein [Amycolatopsis sp. PS_44_ISF1]MDT8915356.1 DUF1266 domain-containing protein [Amycolatopsis sp. PS_44_ISF1]